MSHDPPKRKSRAGAGPHFPYDLKAFGKKLKRLRVARGFTQWEFAEKAGIKADYVSLYERGMMGPRHRTRTYLAAALGVSHEELVKDLPLRADLAETGTEPQADTPPKQDNGSHPSAVAGTAANIKKAEEVLGQQSPESNNAFKIDAVTPKRSPQAAENPHQFFSLREGMSQDGLTLQELNRQWRELHEALRQGISHNGTFTTTSDENLKQAIAALEAETLRLISTTAPWLQSMWLETRRKPSGVWATIEEHSPGEISLPLLAAEMADKLRVLEVLRHQKDARISPLPMRAEQSNMPTNYDFDVALSFAGEDRTYAEALAVCLKAKGIKVFYDAHEKANLWGKDLYVHLHEIYSRRAKFCVIFASEKYAQKLWTNHERRAAQERAFREKGGEYLLPIKLDDTEIPGLHSTVGYVHIREGIDNICKLLLEKLQDASKTP